MVVAAAIFLVLSLIGNILFFSLRFRLARSLFLTAASLGLLYAIFALFVP